MVQRVSISAFSVVSLLLPRTSKRRLTALAAALACAAALWSSPMLPGGLQLGDAALGLGRPDLAARQYERVTRWSPFLSITRRALERSAMVHAVELGNPVRARRDLEWLTRLTADPVDRARLKERVGYLLLEERQPLEAARLLRESAEACRHCSQAPLRLARAAEIAAAHGDPELAHQLFDAVAADWPVWRARAHVGRAQILLRQGRVLEALALFEDASEHTFDADLQTVATLGAATCLERLGNLDQALAELDEADLPDQVRDTRRRGMTARSSL